jgi:hypothetical protein
MTMPGAYENAESIEMDRRIDEALERKPEARVPAGFAAQVAGRAMSMPPRRQRPKLPVRRGIAWASAAVLAVGLFVLAPHATPSLTSAAFDAEVILLTELAGLVLLLSRGIERRQ